MRQLKSIVFYDDINNWQTKVVLVRYDVVPFSPPRKPKMRCHVNLETYINSDGAVTISPSQTDVHTTILPPKLTLHRLDKCEVEIIYMDGTKEVSMPLIDVNSI